MKERVFIRGSRGNMTVKLILEIQDELVTDENIGKYLGITRQAVYWFRKNHGIRPVKNKHLARDASIRQLRKDGKTLKSISMSLGMSISQVYRILKAQAQ